MKIHEYQAKQLFRDYAIPVPPGTMAATVDQVRDQAQALGGTVAVKAQVHAGGRGKAGGIQVAGSPDQAAEAARRILGMEIKGSRVTKVLVEQGADIAREAYLGLIVDRGERALTFICSAEGGVDIEEVAARSPEKIVRFSTRERSFPRDQAQARAGDLLGDGEPARQVLDVMEKLFRLFVDKDCSLAEINPLILDGDGKVTALDGKINFDDNALFRHPDIAGLRDLEEENETELEAKAKGLSFIQLEGEIGCMVNGAGLAMATMDMIQLHGGRPANFLDVGGSSSPEKVVNAFRYILDYPEVRAVLINIFGGITRCDDVARGILEAFDQIEVGVPVVVRLFGTNYEEGLKLLEGTDLIPVQSLAEGVAKAVDLAGQGASS
jgi:succinyl-CoA synthetase beta subunit